MFIVFFPFLWIRKLRLKRWTCQAPPLKTLTCLTTTMMLPNHSTHFRRPEWLHCRRNLTLSREGLGSWSELSLSLKGAYQTLGDETHLWFYGALPLIPPPSRHWSFIHEQFERGSFPQCGNGLSLITACSPASSRGLLVEADKSF